MQNPLPRPAAGPTEIGVCVSQRFHAEQVERLTTLGGGGRGAHGSHPGGGCEMLLSFACLISLLHPALDLKHRPLSTAPGSPVEVSAAVCVQSPSLGSAEVLERKVGLG